eukprot:COSAG02_NODE_274_length_26244_cov_36.943507_2_plen_595_part_00
MEYFKRRSDAVAGHTCADMATAGAGLDEMSVEEKALEIARLRKQTAAASQKLEQASQQAALLDVSLEVEPEPAAAAADVPASAAAAAPAAPPELAAADVASPGVRVSDLEITATFIGDGALGLQFKEDSDPAYLLLEINPQGLAAKQPQITPGLVLKSLNGKPVEGMDFDDAIFTMGRGPRPLELSFWHSAPSPACVVEVAVVGTTLIAGTGWLSSSTTEYAIEATTDAGRKRTVYRSYHDLKMLHLGWVEPLSPVGMPPTFPVDVLFGANDDAVVKERRQQLHIWLVAAFRLAATLACPLLDDALQRALTASAEARQVGLGADHVRSHLPTVIKGAVPPGPRAGVANVWGCCGYWTWGAAADFIAQRKTNPRSSYRGPDPGGSSPGRGTGTIPHVLEISYLTDDTEGLPPTIKAQQLNPEVWGPAPGGVAQLLAKDGPLGGELRLTGVWRSLEVGSKLELELYQIEAADCWGHVWSRKGSKSSSETGPQDAAASSDQSSADGPPSAIQWLDVRVPSLSTVKDLKLATDAVGTIEKFGLETTGLWKGAKIVAVNQKGVNSNVAIFEALNEIDDSGTFGADLILVSLPRQDYPKL